jgi:signal transduction histidine kinase
VEGLSTWIFATLVIACGVTAEALLAAHFYGRFKRDGALLARAWNVALLLLVVAPLSCALSATVGTATLTIAELSPTSTLGETWMTWIIGDIAGICMIVPAALTWAAGARINLRSRDLRLALAAFAGLGLVCAVTFFDLPPFGQFASIEFLAIPLIVLIAYRFGDMIASVVGPAVAGVAVIAAANGYGPFGGGEMNESLLALQMFVMVGILTALYTRAVANERNAAEQEARRLSSDLAHVSRVTMMGEIAAGMAHEYHQPLSAISNYAGASLIKLKPHEAAYAEVREHLERITDEALRAAEIIDRMKEFLQKREPSREPSDVNAIVADALRLTRMAHSFPRVALRHEPTPNLPLVEVDEVQVTQILVNLLVNACEAIESSEINHGEVYVETDLIDPHRIRICVEDNGPGMDDDTARSCVDQFYSTKTHGLGIGLGLSKTLAEAHGGTLYNEPTSQGRGARFCIELPLRA